MTTESGGSHTFTVALTSEPTAEVTIGLSSSNTAEGTVSPNSLVFTAANWNEAQTVTVTGVDDAVADGDVAYTIVTTAAASSDSTYDGLNAANVSATNVDDGRRIWQNTDVPADVNGDGTVTPFDALLIINYLNRHGAGPLPIPAEAPRMYFDVAGNDSVAPLDALLVINALNRLARATGEGESGEDQLTTPGSDGVGVPIVRLEVFEKPERHPQPRQLDLPDEPKRLQNTTRDYAVDKIDFGDLGADREANHLDLPEREVALSDIAQDVLRVWEG